MTAMMLVLTVLAIVATIFHSTSWAVVVASMVLATTALYIWDQHSWAKREETEVKRTEAEANAKMAYQIAKAQGQIEDFAKDHSASDY